MIQSAKCELFTQGFSSDESEKVYSLVSESLPGCRLIGGVSDEELLGAPIFEAQLPRALREKSETFELLFRRLGFVGSHVAAFITERSARVPRLIFLTRASPVLAAKEDLMCVNEQLAAAFESILEIPLSGDALIQLSLRTSPGGLGIPTP